MKNQMLFTVLAALAIYVNAAVLDYGTEADSIQVIDSFSDVEVSSISSRNVISGIIGTGDRVLHRGFYTRLPGAATVAQTQDVTYRSAAAATRITYISALAVGATSSANAQIITGGINANNVTIRLTSQRGLGYEFWVEIWGR